jgi:toxin ParE1/3/4
VSIGFTPLAVSDIDTAADYLESERKGSGTRFRDDLIKLLDRLEALPESAALYEPPSPRHPGLRVAQLLKFRKYCVFYLTVPDGIHVVRCLHGARNVAAMFEPEA